MKNMRMFENTVDAPQGRANPKMFEYTVESLQGRAKVESDESDKELFDMTDEQMEEYLKKNRKKELFKQIKKVAAIGLGVAMVLWALYVKIFWEYGFGS